MLNIDSYYSGELRQLHTRSSMWCNCLRDSNGQVQVSQEQLETSPLQRDQSLQTTGLINNAGALDVKDTREKVPQYNSIFHIRAEAFSVASIPEANAQYTMDGTGTCDVTDDCTKTVWPNRHHFLVHKAVS